MYSNSLGREIETEHDAGKEAENLVRIATAHARAVKDAQQIANNTANTHAILLHFVSDTSGFTPVIIEHVRETMLKSWQLAKHYRDIIARLLSDIAQLNVRFPDANLQSFVLTIGNSYYEAQQAVNLISGWLNSMNKEAKNE